MRTAGPDGTTLPSGFARYWTAAAISAFGTSLTAVAMPVLVVQTLDATSVQVGMVNAAQFLPSAVIGLFAGVYVDQWRRKPVLVLSSIGRGVALAAIPVMWLLGILEIWGLIIALLLFGTFSVFGFAATQSLLPRIVPRSRLVAANSRLDQTDTLSQTLGPAAGGGLIGLIGAPLTIAVNAAGFLVEAIVVAGLRIDEPRVEATADRSLRREIAEGLRWTYRHHALGPLAVSTHVWFIANAAAMTTLAIVALRELGTGAALYGLLMAASALATLVGASIAPALGSRLGAGATIVLARGIYPLAWALVAIATIADAAGTVLLFAALILHGLASGTENANEMGYRQTITPDRLLGRVNATMRSANRTCAAVGAVLCGLVLSWASSTATLVGICVVFVLAVGIAGLTPVRRARIEDDG